MSIRFQALMLQQTRLGDGTVFYFAIFDENKAKPLGFSQKSMKPSHSSAQNPSSELTPYC